MQVDVIMPAWQLGFEPESRFGRTFVLTKLYYSRERFG